MFYLIRSVNKLNRNNLNVRYLTVSSVLEAGHSKWANIRHIKALKDGQKSMIFTKMGRQIRLAAQSGASANPAVNSQLKAAIDEALKKNMPNATIQNILKKFSANQSANKLKKFFLEIAVFNRVSVICIVYTDNFPSMKMTIAPVLKKHFACFAETLHFFDESGLIEAKLPKNLNNEPDIMSLCTEHAIECGAEDVEIFDEVEKIVHFICDPRDLDKVGKELILKNYSLENSEHAFLPKATVEMNEKETEFYEKLITKLKAIEGVEDIYDNIRDK